MVRENVNDMETLLQFVEENEEEISELCMLYEALHKIKLHKMEGKITFKTRILSSRLKRKVNKKMNIIIKKYNALNLKSGDYYINKYWEQKYTNVYLHDGEQNAVNYISHKYKKRNSKILKDTVDTLVLGCCVALPLSVVVPPSIPILTGALLLSGLYHSVKYRRNDKKFERKQKIIALVLSLYYEDFE